MIFIIRRNALSYDHFSNWHTKQLKFLQEKYLQIGYRLDVQKEELFGSGWAKNIFGWWPYLDTRIIMVKFSSLTIMLRIYERDPKNLPLGKLKNKGDNLICSLMQKRIKIFISMLWNCSTSNFVSFSNFCVYVCKSLALSCQEKNQTDTKGLLLSFLGRSQKTCRSVTKWC